ncbi:MAG: efflux RND transporter periplasmic adaptor subunit [Candidatus Zixiibacteriota bacterium]
MKKSVLITIVAVAVLAIAGYFVLQGEPQTTGEEHEEGEVHAEDAGEHAEHEEGHEGMERITLHDDAPILQRLKLAKAGPETILQEIELPGEIVLNADKVAHIVPRFDGIAQAVHKDLGNRVEAGEVLAVVQSNQSVAPYEVKSLVPGTVIEKHITLGEFVRDDADIYVVADLSTVWAKISIYAKYLPLIRPGQAVRLTATGINEVAEGRIDYVNPIVGERTRTGTARVVLSNRNMVWQPGLFVTARIAVASDQVGLAVPDAAVQTIKDKPVVFVKEGNEFEVRPVQLGRSDGTTVEILAGLERGEEYVAAESYIFKAEFGKGEAGEED